MLRMALLGCILYGFFWCWGSTSAEASPGVLVQDVSFEWSATPPRARLLLQVSKTDQVGAGTVVYVGGTGQSLCPVIALHNFLLFRLSVAGPLFVT